MKKINKAILLLLFITIKTFGFAQLPQNTEMRGVWIATVKNLDYPSSGFLSVEAQKKEFTDMLDYMYEIGINAVFFQVRPAADAFYDSPYEPWSEWLTGKQGKAPEPYYDPLPFMIEECHKRDMQFHAWVNPFRAVATVEYADIAENHITNMKPEWFFTYHINKYFDPGIPEVQEYVAMIIQDIVKRYDIDGIHFDDYFYPYPVKDEHKRIIPIPDYNTYTKYNTGFNNIEDWRRENMNAFIKKVSEVVKQEKPHIFFGVSPSGIWRNKDRDPDGSDTRGLAHYDYLFSDVLKWLKNDWIDYVAPQLYWVIGHKYADYYTLVNWWSNHTYGKRLYIGQAAYNAGTEMPGAWTDPFELPKQVQLNRTKSEISGSIWYRAKSLRANPLGLCDSLRYSYYNTRMPAPSLKEACIADSDLFVLNDKNEETPVPEPQKDALSSNVFVTKLGSKLMISWESKKTDAIRFYTVYKYKNLELEEMSKEYVYEKTKEKDIILNRKKLPFFRKKYKLIITATERSGNEYKICEPIFVRL